MSVRLRSWLWGLALCTCVGAASLAPISMGARAEYSPAMEPGRLEVRHASWAAAAACRSDWPADAPGSVLMHIVLSRRGRALRVRTEPDVPRFARCVRRGLRARRFTVTGPDAEHAEWTVSSRFVWPLDRGS